MSLSRPRWEIFRGKDKLYYFHLKATNGEIIISSEGYKNRFDMEHSIDVLTQTLQEDTQIIEIKNSNK